MIHLSATPRPLLPRLANFSRQNNPRYVSSTNQGKREPPQDRRFLRLQRPKGSTVVVLAGTAVLLLSSYQTRRFRNEKIRELPLVTDVWEQYYPNRSIESVAEIIERAGLMGKHRSVKAELDDIRKWHTEHGFKGGLVLRDLTKPLFGMDGGGDTNTTNADTHDLSLHEILEDPTRLARRECYYLYYELKPNGESQQQIFCRGTTLLADIVTCCEAWMVYDEELGCRVHRGFRNHADRILRDVLPLLTTPHATMEVCGHSLGGAAATIVAAKLRRRGYRVVRLTTVGEPRLCATPEDAEKLCATLLPVDQLRVESDRDFVPFLPPFGAPTGHKIWITSSSNDGGDDDDDVPRFVARNNSSARRWTDSVFINFCVPELLASRGQPHRVRNYVKALRKLV